MNQIKQIANLFLKNGLKSVTMDDIARELGVSKKTVYEQFGSKENLICEVVEYHLKDARKLIESVERNSENAIECWMTIARDHIKLQKDFHSSILYDLQKYYPKAWKIFKEHVEGFITSHVIKKIKRGMKEGYFRKNLIPEVVAFHQLSKIENYSNPETFRKMGYNMEDVYEEVLKLQLYGIVSKKGREYLNKKYKYEE